MIESFLVNFIIDGNPYVSREMQHLPSVGDEIKFIKFGATQFIINKVSWILDQKDYYYIEVNVYLSEKKIIP